MSRPNLHLGAREIGILADISEALADGLAVLNSYEDNEPIPHCVWSAVARTAARLALMLATTAARGAWETRPTVH